MTELSTGMRKGKFRWKKLARKGVILHDLDRYIECKDKLLPYLEKLGFNLQKDLSFMPCSGLTGAGLKGPADPQVCPWYQKSPFIPFIDELPPIARFLDRPFLMPILVKYKNMDTGKVMVMGKVEAGQVKKGQTLLVLPNKVRPNLKFVLKIKE